MDQTSVLLKLIGDKSRVQMVRGYYRGLDDGLRVLVDFDQGRVPAHPMTSYRPAINEPVWVMVVDNVAYLVGPTRPLPPEGVVVSVDGGLVAVSTDIGNFEATFPSGEVLTGGQLVKLFWSGEKPHVLSVMSTAVDEATPGGGGLTVLSDRTETFTAVSSGSFGSSWWTSQVWSHPDHVGAWFFGSKIADTIPASASILSVEVFISAVAISGAAANFATHTSTSQPAGTPTFSATTAVAPAAGWVTLPVAFGNRLRAGGGGFGVGVVHGGSHKFHGVNVDPMSGALRIGYRV
jgi:hypothetical protein